jgi:hypothetical protein
MASALAVSTSVATTPPWRVPEKLVSFSCIGWTSTTRPSSASFRR